MANNYFETDPNIQNINSEEEILNILANLPSSRKLLIHQHSLDPNFFDLSTGLAGAVLQKLVNYRVKTAFIVDLTTIKSEKFKEMANEANYGEQFRFFDRKEDAQEWLESSLD